MRAVVPGRPGPPGRAPGAAPGRRAGGGGMRLPPVPPGGGGIGRPAVNGRCGVAAPGVAPGNGRCGGSGRAGAALAPGRDEMTRGVDGGGVAGDGEVDGDVDGAGGGVVAGAAAAAGASTTGATCSTAGATGAATTGAATTGAAGAGVAAASSLDGAEAFAAGFFAAAFLVAGFFAGASSPGSAAFFTGAFFFFGSSGGVSRTSPRSWACRRTRSACASTMPDEGDVAPMANSAHSTSSSLFVMPSSLARTETRTFLFNVVSSLPSPWIRQLLRCRPAVRQCPRPRSRSSRRGACRRSARPTSR